MQIPVEFREPFSYTKIITLLLFILIVGIILFFILTRKRKKKIQIIAPPKKDLRIIKNKYIQQLDNLLNDSRNEKVKYREAYITLSRIIREFIFEATGINVTAVSLAEVKPLNLPQLYELMKEYYVPEFAYFFKGNIENSIVKTRGVIEVWK